MTIVHTELYKALKEANVSDETATAAAQALAEFFRLVKKDLSPPGSPDPGIVRELEALLALAQRGKLRWLGYAGRLDDGTVVLGNKGEAHPPPEQTLADIKDLIEELLKK